MIVSMCVRVCFCVCVCVLWCVCVGRNLMCVGVEWICGHFISAIELIKKTF